MHPLATVEVGGDAVSVFNFVAGIPCGADDGFVLAVAGGGGGGKLDSGAGATGAAGFGAAGGGADVIVAAGGAETTGSTWRAFFGGASVALTVFKIDD